MSQTIYEVLSRAVPNENCLYDQQKRCITYGELLNHVDYVIDFLRSRGIQHDDRVAVVLENGPEMASSFLAVSCAAIVAPLNPAYREKEY